MTWMSTTHQYTATLAELGALLGYSVKDPNDPEYFRIHGPNQQILSAKPHIYHCYDEGRGAHHVHNVTKMTNKYHTIHKILRNTIHVKFGERN